MCDSDITNYIPAWLKLHADGKTCVFWDVEDYPIPDGLDPASLYRNIKEAIKNRGLHGEVSILAYVGDKSSDESRREYEDAGFIIEYLPKGGKDARICTMELDFVLWAFESPKPTNVIILAKHIGDDTGYSLMGLYIRNHGVFSSESQPLWNIPCASSTLFLTSLFDGPSGSSKTS